ncbi:MAG: dihydroneopterin aldolase, partial [Actinobacteria bacterium]|nr:dihydroneopterin aldolase [Actinomycetota bacterium]
MSDSILITGIHGFGYHGLFDHERTDGQDFFVDVLMHVDLLAASLSDDIEDTVNYGLITELVVNEITSDPVSLIEKLAGRIAEKILNSQEKALEVTVTV